MGRSKRVTHWMGRIEPVAPLATEPRQRRIANFLAAAVILAFSLLAGSGIFHHAKRQDFLNIYTGARLALEGQFPRLHDPALQLAREQELAGPSRTLVPFVRPHFYALALSPLALLPWDSAFVVWILLQLGFLLALLILAAQLMGSESAVLVAMFTAPILGLLHGQDSYLVALLALLGFRALELGHETRGGLWWSLLLIKFHLALGPAAALIAARRWRAFRAFLLGCVLLGAINLALSGAEGARLYAQMLLNPATEGLYPAPQKLACLQGLAATLPLAPHWTHLAIGLPIVFSLIRGVRNLHWRTCYALIQGGALYLTPHVHLYDWSVLTPAFLSSAGSRNPLRLRGLSLFLLSPLAAAAFLGSIFTQPLVHLAYLAWLAVLAWAMPSPRWRASRAAPES